MKRACYELQTEHLEHDLFPEEDFDFLIEFLQSQDVLKKAEGVHPILLIFEVEWDMLTEEQRRQLLPVLESIFPRIQDHLGAFLIPEILGENFQNEGALNVLERLSHIENTKRRAQIPHGLKHFIEGKKEGALVERACELLHQLLKDGSEEVLNEAKASFARVQAKGFCKQICAAPPGSPATG